MLKKTMSEARRKVIAGARMRRLREELGLSQSAMASELGISVSYLNLIERNQRPVTAQLLIRLSEQYAVDPRSFAGEEDSRAATELDEILADPMFAPHQVPRSEVRQALETAPALVAVLKRLYTAYGAVASGINGLSAIEQTPAMQGEPGEPTVPSTTVDILEAVRSFLQENNNYFPELEKFSETIHAELTSDNKELSSALSKRLSQRHSLRVQVMPVTAMGTTLRHLDRHRRKLMISEVLEPPGRLFQMAYQLALLEADNELEQLSQKLGKSNPQVRRFTKVTLANYCAAATLMPYQPFFEAAEKLGYNVDVLAMRFSTSFEQVAHRLTTLASPTARGIPFFMIRVDTAGNVSKRFSSGAFPFSRFGGTCPRWNIHNAFRNPDRVETQIIQLEDGKQWFSIAKSVKRIASSWGEPEAPFAIGLGCEAKYMPRLVYASTLNLKALQATEIGINCRLCRRPNCLQRSAPHFLEPIAITENTRGFSPFGY